MTDREAAAKVLAHARLGSPSISGPEKFFVSVKAAAEAANVELTDGMHPLLDADDYIAESEYPGWWFEQEP